MKNIIKICLTLFLTILLFTTANAAVFRSGDLVVIPADMVIRDNLYVSGQQIKIAGRVEGDIFAIGNCISIEGPVDGDIFALGKCLKLRPRSVNDIKALGKNVSLGGRITHDIFALGQNVLLRGHINGSAYISARNLSVLRQAMVRKELQVKAANFQLARGARINRLVREQQVDTAKVARSAATFGPRLLLCTFILNLVILFLFIWLISAFMPNQLAMVTRSIQSATLKNIGIGFLSLLLIPLSIFILAVSVVGLPFAVILSFFFALALYLCKIFISVSLGEWLAAQFGKRTKQRAKRAKPQKQHPLVHFILGLIIYQIIVIIPILGRLFSFFALLLGLGAIVATRFSTYDLARKKGVI